MMNIAEIPQAKAASTTERNVIHFPLGLLGFEEIKEYELVYRPEEEPFLWLQKLDNPNHAFLVISPFAVQPAYQPDLSHEDVNFLGLQKAEDALVLNIVTLRSSATPTLNMRGPIVINRHTRKAKQVIPVNAPELPLKFPLPVAS